MRLLRVLDPASVPGSTVVEWVAELCQPTSWGDEMREEKRTVAVMMLAAGYGTELTLEARGPDEDRAVDEIVALVSDRFGEDE